MKRTKEWWAALTARERSYLVYGERHYHCMSEYKGEADVPDDCSECRIALLPVFGHSFCIHVSREINRIIAKADFAVLNGSVLKRDIAWAKEGVWVK